MAFCVSDVMDKAEVILHMCLSCHKPVFVFCFVYFLLLLLLLLFSIIIVKRGLKWFKRWEVYIPFKRHIFCYTNIDWNKHTELANGNICTISAISDQLASSLAVSFNVKFKYDCSFFFFCFSLFLSVFLSLSVSRSVSVCPCLFLSSLSLSLSLLVQ